MAEIVIEDLKKEFGDFVAVTSSNLTIRDGDFFVLLGPSGCGKTTTLRMIAGLEYPTHGKIFLDAKDITFLRASERDIAFVFQMFALYPHMNVEKNIGFPLKTQGVKKSERKKSVREIAKLLHLDKVLKSKVSALSGGDKQRVALGRAIIRRPKAFLMDEPLGSLDAEFRELMCFELKKMHNDINATTVYVTHDQNEAMAMGDRIGIMDQGVMLQADDPLTIYNKPRAKFVGSFLGSPAMNFIEIPSFVKKGNSSVKINGSQLAIPECHEDSHTDFNYLGIRPENISVADNGDIRGTVYGVEYLGANKIITVDTEFGRIKARVPSVVHSRIGDNVGLIFNSNSIIIFNGDDESAIRSQLMI